MKTNKLMNDIRGTMSAEMKARMELMVGVSNRIYDVLEAKGLSQKDFANLIGKTETEISRWLSGTHNLTVATIAKISAALGEDIVVPAKKKPSKRSLAADSPSSRINRPC